MTKSLQRFILLFERIVVFIPYFLNVRNDAATKMLNLRQRSALYFVI